MPQTKILAIGKFLPEDLLVSVSESNRKIKPEIENQIDDIWQRIEQKAREEGRVCYNGLGYRLNSLEK